MSTVAPTDAGLAAELDRHIKTFATRRPDWRVFAVETKKDERFSRAQRRYVGASGSVTHVDPNVVPAEVHTLTIMEQPAGHIQPMHHHDEAEIFFVLEGELTIVWKQDGETVERKVGKWDMVYNPPGVIHGIRNDSDQTGYFQVMLASPQPARPQYEDPELQALQAADNPDKG